MTSLACASRASPSTGSSRATRYPAGRTSATAYSAAWTGRTSASTPLRSTRSRRGLAVSCLHYLSVLLTLPACSPFRYSLKGWALDQTYIFVLVDAYIQRFRDLLEVKTHTGTLVRRCVSPMNPLSCSCVTASSSLLVGRMASRGRCRILVAARDPNSCASS